MIEKLRINISRLVAVVLIIIILISDNYWETSAPFLSEVLFFIGAVLATIASFGRLWCSLYIAGYKTDKLITQGPYSMCRNPLYFFSFIGGIGVGFASETFFIPIVILLAFAAYYPLVIKKEEEQLKKKHEMEFKTYFDNVPRFFPKISLFTEPQEYIVKPIVFRKHILDAIWFVLAIVILEIIKDIHTLKVLPGIFQIY